MIRALRYVLANIVYTTWASARIIWGAYRNVTGDAAREAYDEVPRRWGRKMLDFTGMVLAIEGVEHLPPGPAVFVANHASWADIWIILVGVQRPIRFIYKKELSKIPVLGKALYSSGHFEIDRQNRGSAFEVYDRAAEQIRGGMSAVVFAEGTRSRTGRLMPFKKGPFVLAISAGVPVVPTAILGSYDSLPTGSMSPKPGMVKIVFGEPIPTAGLNYDSRDLIAGRTRAAILAMGARE